MLTSKDLYLRYGITTPDYRYYDDNGSLLTKQQALVNTRYKYIKGQLVEAMVCSAPTFNAAGYDTLKSDRRVYSRRSDTPDPENVRRAQKRARQRLEDLIRCNDWSHFVTLTFDGALIDRADYSQLVKKVNVYLDNRVRRRGWSYVGVVEYHKNKKGLHFHFLVNGDLSLVDSGTVIRPTGGKPVKASTAYRQGFVDSELKTVYNLSDWAMGFSTAIAVYGDSRALARYVGKYLTKSDQSKIGGRWFYHGGELCEPEYRYDNLDFESFVGTVEFDTDGGGFKIAYYD